ncbi:MAG: hypothetical protein LBE71_05365, partial [Dysgonamonadaceae bacterium]|nr:hypothetical protein [Dysgonamonadaceae bacterium]
RSNPGKSVIANCAAVKQSRNYNDAAGGFSGLPRRYAARNDVHSSVCWIASGFALAMTGWVAMTRERRGALRGCPSRD